MVKSRGPPCPNRLLKLLNHYRVWVFNCFTSKLAVRWYQMITSGLLTRPCYTIMQWKLDSALYRTEDQSSVVQCSSLLAYFNCFFFILLSRRGFLDVAYKGRLTSFCYWCWVVLTDTVTRTLGWAFLFPARSQRQTEDSQRSPSISHLKSFLDTLTVFWCCLGMGFLIGRFKSGLAAAADFKSLKNAILHPVRLAIWSYCADFSY